MIISYSEEKKFKSKETTHHSHSHIVIIQESEAEFQHSYITNFKKFQTSH